MGWFCPPTILFCLVIVILRSEWALAAYAESKKYKPTIPIIVKDWDIFAL
jgi:hypothetical protein